MRCEYDDSIVCWPLVNLIGAVRILYASGTAIGDDEQYVMVPREIWKMALDVAYLATKKTSQYYTSANLKLYKSIIRGLFAYVFRNGSYNDLNYQGLPNTVRSIAGNIIAQCCFNIVPPATPIRDRFIVEKLDCEPLDVNEYPVEGPVINNILYSTQVDETPSYQRELVEGQVLAEVVITLYSMIKWMCIPNTYNIRYCSFDRRVVKEAVLFSQLHGYISQNQSMDDFNDRYLNILNRLFKDYKTPITDPKIIKKYNPENDPTFPILCKWVKKVPQRFIERCSHIIEGDLDIVVESNTQTGYLLDKYRLMSLSDSGSTKKEENKKKKEKKQQQEAERKAQDEGKVDREFKAAFNKMWISRPRQSILEREEFGYD